MNFMPLKPATLPPDKAPQGKRTWDEDLAVLDVNVNLIQ
jgi:hypothetical protein